MFVWCQSNSPTSYVFNVSVILNGASPSTLIYTSSALPGVSASVLLGTTCPPFSAAIFAGNWVSDAGMCVLVGEAVSRLFADVVC